ncbi:MAG: alpha/beta hydrolase fold domain-containing protein [Gammaproteobacteria bacterium]|nr:alpha/beta hydrolase fold domain-containing protein [Gammaproteobacteria bacterium]
MQEASLDQPIILEPKQTATSAVIWLHGLGADGHDFAGIVPSLELPENSGVRFIFPHAPEQAVTINGGMVMRSWYDIRTPDFLSDVDEQGIRTSCRQIEVLINTQVEQGIAADRIVLAGFSQGGLIALHAGLTYEKSLAGIMALSTYCPLVEDFKQNKRVSILMTHGTFDNVIPLAVGEHSAQQLTQQGYSLEWRAYPMEHQVCAEEIADIAAWLTKTLTL